MTGKEKRLHAMFAEDGKGVYVPVDHGIGGIKKGLENPIAVISRLLELGIDGTLLQIGMVKQTKQLFETAPSAVARVIAMDYRHCWRIPGKNERVMDCFQSVTVEQAMEAGCTAVKVMIPYGGEERIVIEHIKILTNVIREADRCQVPVMVEPVPAGSCPPEYANSHEVVANACRIAVELGADVLKIPYTREPEKFAQLVRVSHVPVTVLGGSPKDIRDVLTVTKEIMDCGARAVVFGRNVWGHPKMDQVVMALKAIVHGGVSVEETIESYQLSGSAVTDNSYAL